MNKPEDLENRDPSLHGQVLGDTSHLDESRARIDYVIESFASNLPASMSKDELRKYMREYYEKVLEIEKQLVGQRTRECGYEALTTDTCGHRTTYWFEQTGLAFSPGFASTSVAAAVYSDEIGMGASQRNTITVDDVVDYLVRSLMSPPITVPDNEDRRGMLITLNPDELISRAQQTVLEAFDEFGEAAQGRTPIQKAGVFVYGINYLRNPLVDIINRAVVARLPSIPFLRQGNVATINFSSNLGHTSEVVYGGNHHPQFRIPSFVRHI